MAFYYHFKDIYDLVEWSCFEDASRALAGKKTYDTWQEGLLQIFEAVLENKPFILNVYRTLSREQIENYLFRLVYDLIMGVVEEKAAGLRVTQQQKQFVAEFYKYSFVCVMLDWIRGGMKDDYHTIVNDICTTMHGAISNSLRNFADSDKIYCFINFPIFYHSLCFVNSSHRSCVLRCARKQKKAFPNNLPIFSHTEKRLQELRNQL